MGCHPKPIDELHHFAEGWFNQQPENNGHPCGVIVGKAMRLGQDFTVDTIQKPWCLYVLVVNGNDSGSNRWRYCTSTIFLGICSRDIP